MGWSTFFGEGKPASSMVWKQLTERAQVEQLLRDSGTRPQLIFKHSTRCSISSMALSRLEKDWNLQGKVDAWYLDLLAYRDISNAIATNLHVMHESPQAILLVDGKVIDVSSHSAIAVHRIAKALPA